jgi:glycerol-3-phosphate dehydrogenase
MRRSEKLEKLSEIDKISVLIIGAGINGIGSFRELSLHGVDVLMVDKGDFCAGASSASSHMVHGGIRYLEYGEFRLVKEAVKERNRLLMNAPHLVKPLPTIIPMFKWFSGLFNAPFKFIGLRNKPAERGALMIKVGLMLYDKYTKAQKTVPHHQFLSHEETLKRFPEINPAVVSSAMYYDGKMDSPERICIELIGDAEKLSRKALAINYLAAIDGDERSVTLEDQITHEKYIVRPKVVINAGGPWIDFINKSIGKESEFIGGTKGSHLVLENSELREAIKENEFFFENKDGRIVLIFPLLDKVLVGTTDIWVEDPDDVVCTDDEVDYFMNMVNVVFPSIKVDSSQIVYKFSGVRPLPYSEVEYTGQISRDHSIKIIESKLDSGYLLLSLIGGKWTSFRAFSEQVADKAFGFLGFSREYSTKNMPIGGGKDYPSTKVEKMIWVESLSDEIGIPKDRVEVLFNRYGTLAKEFAYYISQQEDRPLRYQHDYSSREIEFIVKDEGVVHLDDLILRRTLMAFLGELDMNLLEELSWIAGKILGWSEEQRNQEVLRTKTILASKHGVII